MHQSWAKIRDSTAFFQLSISNYQKAKTHQLNRHIMIPAPPGMNSIRELPHLPVNQFELDNGLPIYALTGSDQPVVKVELVFFAGRPYEDNQLVATTCAALLREGTHKTDSAKLATQIDYYGASITSSFTFDTVSLQLYCLNKHFTKLLPILAEIVQFAAYPSTELEIFRRRVKQRLAIDLAQNEINAYRKATELYFGNVHPYGYNSTPEMYDQVTQAMVQQHHRQLLHAGNVMCLVAGQPPEDYVEQLNLQLGQWKGTHAPVVKAPIVNPNEGRRWEAAGSNAQTAIRIGRPLFNRQHKDFAGMFALNTVLGGYFGSRLMRNLREEKGLTYGVESSLETMRYGGYFTISLETEQQHTSQAMGEIYREISLLQEKLMTDEELRMVRNYLAGYLLSLMDGPIQLIDIIRGNLIRGNSLDFTATLLKELHDLTPDHIRNLARKYLDTNELIEVVIH